MDLHKFYKEPRYYLAGFFVYHARSEAKCALLSAFSPFFCPAFHPTRSGVSLRKMLNISSSLKIQHAVENGAFLKNPFSTTH